MNEKGFLQGAKYPSGVFEHFVNGFSVRNLNSLCIRRFFCHIRVSEERQKGLWKVAAMLQRHFALIYLWKIYSKPFNGFLFNALGYFLQLRFFVFTKSFYFACTFYLKRSKYSIEPFMISPRDGEWMFSLKSLFLLFCFFLFR